MIAGMKRCTSCEDAPARWVMRAWRLRRYRAWRVERPGTVQRAEVCETCAQWLAGLVVDARSGAETGLLGVPGSGGRHLVFDDQCAACCDSPTEVAYGLRWECDGAVAGELFLCPGCARWLLGLATAGRTARGRAERSLDGPYGVWPHPRLRGLSVWLDADDPGLERLVAMAAASMGMAQAPRPGGADVAIVEASARGRAQRAAARLGARARAVIVASPAGSGVDTLAAMAAGAAGWMTVPSTPQQLTWAIARAVRREVRSAAIDPGTGLPIALRKAIERPWLAVRPPGGEEGWSAAWQVRRFSRGYDEVAVVDGGLAVVPVAPPGSVGRVRERLLEILGAGWEVELALPGQPGLRRLDAAG